MHVLRIVAYAILQYYVMFAYSFIRVSKRKRETKNRPCCMECDNFAVIRHALGYMDRTVFHFRMGPSELTRLSSSQYGEQKWSERGENTEQKKNSPSATEKHVLSFGIRHIHKNLLNNTRFSAPFLSISSRLLSFPPFHHVDCVFVRAHALLLRDETRQIQ